VEEELGYLEVFEEHLGSSDTIADWVIGWLSQENWVFPWVDLELFEDVPPDCFHVIPVLDDAVVHWVA